MDGVTEYLIKWEGWDEKDNTWEPADNVGDDLVEEFEEELRKKIAKPAARQPR